jgi:hypothetical protein
MVLSLQTFCLTAIEAHHPDSRLVDSCECENRVENHLSQTLAHHKNYEAYQINLFHMSLKGTECSCRSSTNKIMKKKHVLNYGPHSEIDICSCNDCSFERYVCNDCKRSNINLREFRRVQCLVKKSRRTY